MFLESSFADDQNGWIYWFAEESLLGFADMHDVRREIWERMANDIFESLASDSNLLQFVSIETPIPTEKVVWTSGHYSFAKFTIKSNQFLFPHFAIFKHILMTLIWYSILAFKHLVKCDLLSKTLHKLVNEL